MTTTDGGGATNPPLAGLINEGGGNAPHNINLQLTHMTVIKLAALTADQTLALHSAANVFDAAFDAYADFTIDNAAGVGRYGFDHMTDSTDSYSIFDTDDMDYVNALFD